MPSCEIEYLSIGGNRQSPAADCSLRSSLVAFGADVNVAIWSPKDPEQNGIRAVLKGHVDRVSAVRFSIANVQEDENLISGSADGDVRLWRPQGQVSNWRCLSTVKAHGGAVNAIAFLSGCTVFATGGADCLVKIWKIEADTMVPLHTITLKPRYIPLALVLGGFSAASGPDPLSVVVGGTKANVQIFVIQNLHTEPCYELQATLSGHEGWIRSLSLLTLEDGYLLASASHDKYVRIWRIRSKHRKSWTHTEDNIEKTLTRKVQSIGIAESMYVIVFEALLLGHEDWVYSASWCPAGETQQLLTASADGSLAIWEPDSSSGIWVSKSRLGEISGQKGATTATGSAGGFWTGLWSPDGHDIMCLDRTGSWRLWQHDQSSDYWAARPGVSGHIGATNGISWSQGGDYLLSTGSDQTTRLHAEWKRGSKRTWHEFARPQIHGYDLNCVTSIGPRRFVSGADEKLLRVFDEPKNVASMLTRLCSIEQDDRLDLPDAASMPVLGLSNKVTDDRHSAGVYQDVAQVNHSESEVLKIPLDCDEPPTEDLLARHTLWPEHEKLYGHGYEISEAASNDDGTVLATACKASSIDHAVIRLYDTADWHEIKPALVAHSLTVTRLAFSPASHRFLLSVGRDRQWTVFQQEDGKREVWKNFQAFPKAHSRMILDAAWSPISKLAFFATAGRDKSVKLWHLVSHEQAQSFALAETITCQSAVTAVSFTSDRSHQQVCLAVGEEDGLISFHTFSPIDGLSVVKSWELEAAYCPSKAVTRIQWRPRVDIDNAGTHLAISAADGSVRVLWIEWESKKLTPGDG